MPTRSQSVTQNCGGPAHPVRHRDARFRKPKLHEKMLGMNSLPHLARDPDVAQSWDVLDEKVSLTHWDVTPELLVLVVE